jgi:phage baseplate assembly protein W
MPSIKVPFQFDSGRVLTTNSPSTVAEQKIVDVLVTSNYERPMRHTYGAEINKLLFEPIDSLKVADFSTDAQQEMNANITRVSILGIRVSNSETMASYGNERTTLGITVEYQIPLGSPKVFSFKVGSAGVIVEDTPI